MLSDLHVTTISPQDLISLNLTPVDLRRGSRRLEKKKQPVWLTEPSPEGFTASSKQGRACNLRVGQRLPQRFGHKYGSQLASLNNIVTMRGLAPKIAPAIKLIDASKIARQLWKLCLLCVITFLLSCDDRVLSIRPTVRQCSMSTLSIATVG